MDKELITAIDNVLKECQQRGSVCMTQDTTLIESSAIQTAEAMELIAPKDKNSFRLTNQGLDVIQGGGFDRFQKKIEEEKKIDLEIKDLTLKELKRNIFQLDYWWLFLLLNVFLSGVMSFLVFLLTK